MNELRMSYGTEGDLDDEFDSKLSLNDNSNWKWPCPATGKLKFKRVHLVRVVNTNKINIQQVLNINIVLKKYLNQMMCAC